MQNVLGYLLASLSIALDRPFFVGRFPKQLENPNDGHPLIYTIRLHAYLLILGAIVHKNRR